MKSLLVIDWFFWLKFAVEFSLGLALGWFITKKIIYRIWPKLNPKPYVPEDYSALPAKLRDWARIYARMDKKCT